MCDYEYPEAVVADNPGIRGRRWWEPERRAGENAQPEKGKAESVEEVRHDGE
ncbi:hypothetical protein [Desulfovibrio porci]|uniref:hypothetical protein n=1 Tax=Desulfovibrio porci TaxID=2605782 RepID=UPI003A92A368